MIERHSDPIEILRAAKRLLMDERRVVRNGRRIAENSAGNAVWPTDDDACRWCMKGAIDACCDFRQNDAWEKTMALFKRATRELGFSHVSFTDLSTNKRITHAQIMQTFDLAIMLGGGTDANAPLERCPSTGMTVTEQDAARRLLNETMRGLGDATVRGIDSARSID